MYSGRILKNWINACHLKRLRDEPRSVIYNEYHASADGTSGSDPPEQRS